MIEWIRLTRALLPVALLLAGCGTPPAPTAATNVAAVDERGAYRTDFAIPAPAFHGLEPALRLSYDSLSGNGPVGVGWRISGVSTISRVSPGKGAPDYTTGDLFLLDGMELVPCAAGSVSPSCRYPSAPSDMSYSTRIESFRPLT